MSDREVAARTPTVDGFTDRSGAGPAKKIREQVEREARCGCLDGDVILAVFDLSNEDLRALLANRVH